MMTNEDFHSLFNFSSRADSLSIGADMEIENDTGQSTDDEEDLRWGGQRKRTRVNSASDEQSGAGDVVQEQEAPAPSTDNNNPDDEPPPPAPDDQAARHPVPGARRGSPVYLCARKIDTNKFKCNYCKAQLLCPQGSTTSISTHMTRFHSKQPEVVQMVKILDDKRKEKEKSKKEKETEGKQLSIKGFVTGGKPVDPVRKKKINAKLIDFIIANNESFSVVDSPSFRALIFELEPGLILMSRHSATRGADERAASARENLRTEILEDLKKAGHSTVSITSDHGTSRDSHRTRKNVLTISRTLEDFSIKCDTLDLIICEESQTGANIRSSVKASLVKWAGYNAEKMTVNWVTDNEAKQVSARNPNYHQDSGLLIHYEAGCVDHLIELAVTDALKRCYDMEKSVKIAKDIINYMKESSLGRVKLMCHAENLGLKPLSIVKGTLNRWFSKFFEMNRFLDLEQALKEFQGEDLPTSVAQAELDDWENLHAYVKSLKPIVDSATMLESETSCTSSSVIPFISTILDELNSLKAASRKTAHSSFYGELIGQLSRRFPNQYKLMKPYNALTLLDPRHLDIYFNEEETELAKSVILQDKVYKEENSVAPVQEVDNVPTAAVPTPNNQVVQSKNQSLRDKLLQKRFVDTQINTQNNNAIPFEEKIEKEFTELLNLKFTGLPDTNSNPSNWWKDNHKKFPLLSKFWKAHSSFPATSTASERVFNVDGLVISPLR